MTARSFRIQMTPSVRQRTGGQRSRRRPGGDAASPAAELRQHPERRRVERCGDRDVERDAGEAHASPPWISASRRLVPTIHATRQEHDRRHRERLGAAPARERKRRAQVPVRERVEGPDAMAGERVSQQVRGDTGDDEDRQQSGAGSPEAPRRPPTRRPTRARRPAASATGRDDPASARATSPAERPDRAALGVQVRCQARDGSDGPADQAGPGARQDDLDDRR